MPIFGRSGKEAPFWWHIFADFTLIAPSSDEQLDLLTEHDEKQAIDEYLPITAREDLTIAKEISPFSVRTDFDCIYNLFTDGWKNETILF